MTDTELTMDLISVQAERAGIPNRTVIEDGQVYIVFGGSEDFSRFQELIDTDTMPNRPEWSRGYNEEGQFVQLPPKFGVRVLVNAHTGNWILPIPTSDLHEVYDRLKAHNEASV